MPNYRRAEISGGTFFFTVVTFRRRPFLIDEEVRAALRDAITRTRTTLPFTIDAWVLLPDHLHCVWTLPDGDANFSTRWRLIKTFVMQRCHHFLHDPTELSDRRRAKAQSTVWQNRFWEHQIRNENDFEKHVDYIHWNPVKHGYVTRPIDWRWSSMRRYVDAGILPENWAESESAVDQSTFGE